MPSARALIIDDNPINLELLELLVEAEGFEVTGVAGAEEAMTVLDIFVPELFIVDVQLPGMSGLDLCACFVHARTPRKRAPSLLRLTRWTRIEKTHLRPVATGILRS